VHGFVPETSTTAFAGVVFVVHVNVTAVRLPVFALSVVA